MELLTNHWLLISFLAPMFWSIVNIIDIYFVGGVYQDELDGAIIIGLFQIIPCVLIFYLFGINFNDFLINTNSLKIDLATWLNLLGGLAFGLSFYFYFKALFSQVDVALLQIIWSLTVVIVPIISFFAFKEQLPLRSYLGMLITLSGVALISFHKNIRLKMSGNYLKIMAAAALLLSISMILQDQAYALLDIKYNFTDKAFAVGFIGFAFGAFLCSLLLALGTKRRPIALVKKYWKWFLLLEGVTFLGNLSSQRAISIAPSVSYVATIETFVPVFILIFSVLVLIFFKTFFNNNKEKISLIYKEQLTGAHYKILATIIMAVGVYLIS